MSFLTCLFVCLHLSASLSVCVCILTCLCLSVCLSVYLSVLPSLSLSLPSAGTWYTTYTRVPHYITSELRSLYLHSLEYTEFDLTGKNTAAVTVDSRTIVGGAFTGGWCEG